MVITVSRKNLIFRKNKTLFEVIVKQNYKDSKYLKKLIWEIDLFCCNHVIIYFFTS